MRLSAMLVLVALGIAAALGVGRPAYARTATPTPTATPTVTPTPAPIARFGAYVWVDAQRMWEYPVVPKIGDKVCGQDTLMIVTENGSYREVEVVAASIVPGCGVPGATITFWVNGKRANQTAQWFPGENQRLAVVVGAPFAQFGGHMNLEVSGDGQEDIVPFINGKECGYTDRGFFGMDEYAVVVYANEFRPGCGVDGSEVAFKLVNLTSGEVRATAVEKGVWHPMGSGEINLTLVPVSGITMGGTGTGGGSRGGANVWEVVATALCAAGSAGIAAGVALRKRMTTR